MKELNPTPPNKPSKVIRYLVVMAVMVVIVLVIVLVPYKDIVVQRGVEVLESTGLKVSDIRVEKISDTEALISQLNLGQSKLLKLKNIKVVYDVNEIINGKLKGVAIDKIEVDVYKDGGKWLVGGIEGVFNQPTSDKEIKFSQYMPEYISLKDIVINAKQGSTSFSADAKVELNYDRIKNELSGSISAPIDISNPSISIPKLMFEANIKSDLKDVSSIISVKDKSNTVSIDAELSGKTNDLKKAKILIKRLQFPYSGGMVSSKNISTTVAMDKPIYFNINLLNVELEELLGRLTKDEIKGSGQLSGTVPVVYYPDGKLEVKEGFVDSQKNGIITVSPALIPGENEHVLMARTVLQNFHYSYLKMTLSYDKNGESLINLAIEGGNPDYLNGKKVKLNINLSGDTMSMLQQDLVPLNDIKK